MTVSLTYPWLQFFDSNADVLSGGKLFFYEAGTTTKITTYSDSGLSVANTNPIILDAAGRPEVDIFLSPDDYKIVLTDSTDTDPPASPIWTKDNYNVVSPATFTASETVNAQTGTSYTIQTTDRAKLITATNSNAQAYTLPQADSSNFPDGWYTTIANTGSGTVTITPATSTLDGLATYTLIPGEIIRINSDGTNYQIGAIGLKNPGVNAQTGTSYTVLTSDRNALVTFSNASAVTVSLPQANSTTFKDGWAFYAYNKGAGTATIVPSTSTINGAANLKLLTNRGALIVSDGTNYQVFGWVDTDNIDIDGGAIDGITLGTNSAVTEAQIDNINIDGNEISSTNTDGDISLNPNGSGRVDVNTSIIENVTDPTSAQHAATKNYVDAQALNVEVFTSSGTFTVPSDVSAVKVIVVGGGAGGHFSGGATIPVAGGGAGGAAIEYITSSLGSSVSVTVGAGGTGGTSGDNDGTAGGTSSFGAFCSASGGGVASGSAGGAGGIGSGGDINIRGGDGSNGGGGSNYVSGNGGSSFMGGGGRGSSSSGVAGSAGGNYGGGGGGGLNANGGAGAGGIVIVEYLT